MNARLPRRLSLLGLAVLTPALLLTGAGTSTAAGPLSPPHVGDPRVWGPPLAALCDSPGMAAAAGYTVVVLDNQPNVFTGTPGPDAIYANGGNDRIDGAGGDDVICLSFGNDRGRGGPGNDAIFGEEHDDRLLGDTGRDHLDGGSQNDVCDGGAALDRQDRCEVAISVP